MWKGSSGYWMGYADGSLGKKKKKKETAKLAELVGHRITKPKISVSNPKSGRSFTSFVYSSLP